MNGWCYGGHGRKKTKKELKPVVRDWLFAVEALSTFLTEVEGIMNSRPLTAASGGINNLELITPYHLLICKWSYHLCIFQKQKISLRNKWKAVKAATDMFWKRWMKEYLPTNKKVADGK